MPDQTIKLTEYSHGAGCGCKISPKVLSTILASQLPVFTDPNLLVGNQTRDDAAVYKLNEQTGIISTTDFFMPIVDDPFTFGRIAATNAISDIYAMGGTPIMAIAILGWPINLLAAEIAQKVVDGGRQACADAGIMLAGGHSIDAPEPIFGLAVTGQIPLEQVKKNNTAKANDRLYITKPIGIGILTTAQKQKKLRDEDSQIAPNAMCQLNTIGIDIAKIVGVNALTDVTGFGLAGHLIEVCQGAKLKANLILSQVPLLPKVSDYLAQGCIPGGTHRNFDSYSEYLPPLTDEQKAIICDPQTSGGLLVSVSAEAENELKVLLETNGIAATCIGTLHEYEPRADGYDILMELS
ncbi:MULTISPECIES: selenide, water dikinase SelD [Shewanella]|uniref:Selenide, water dikinase n=1 Tax=Shewanella psychromarinicola TaxID=2487742 RepID=A0A3N4E728_9GAMM|nr:selenide, water dikinase SelD [Shewanella psychromarinicola]AZG34462.1 selenide, water dikinase SelD [Shewanella psychromarinicola]MCL1084365.1 selenide, water dikinase SelD [Shewanella psychromarinicola]RPA32562.1 selenide, water dikinase SelD [Shewanella psychromarinicola]